MKNTIATAIIYFLLLIENAFLTIANPPAILYIIRRKGNNFLQGKIDHPIKDNPFIHAMQRFRLVRIPYQQLPHTHFIITPISK